MFSTMPPPLPHVKTGKLRALGVTGARRARVVPDTPTVAEAGVPGFTVENWQGIVAPAKTPAAIIERLRAETAKVLAQPSTIAMLGVQGLDAVNASPAEFDTLIRTEIGKWRAVVKAANIVVD